MRPTPDRGDRVTRNGKTGRVGDVWRDYRGSLMCKVSWDDGTGSVEMFVALTICKDTTS